MITTTTRLEPIRPQDGSLLDRNPFRRAARLRASGVAIERVAPLSYVVRLPDGRAERRRTFTGAERVAHSYVDRALAA